MAGGRYGWWGGRGKGRVTVGRVGSGVGEAGMHDIGTGTYTVMQQVAADALGLAPEKVEVRLGDTRLPASHAAIGSATIAHPGAPALLAANGAREKAEGPAQDTG